MPVRPLLILLTAALASGAQAAAERRGWCAQAAQIAALIDGAWRVGFDPGPQAGAGPKGDYP